MAEYLAMATEGTSYSGDNLNISWPAGGARKVQRMPDAERSRSIARAIAEGAIVEIDGPTGTDREVAGPAPSTLGEYQVLRGDAARAKLQEPAGPVTIRRRQSDGTVRTITLGDVSVAQGLSTPGEGQVSASEARANEAVREAEKREQRSAPAPDDDEGDATVADLREELKAAGLPVSGRKADLIARLEEHRQASSATQQPEQQPASGARAPSPGGEVSESEKAAVEANRAAEASGEDADEAAAKIAAAKAEGGDPGPNSAEGGATPTVPPGASPTARRDAVKPQQG